MLNVLKSSRPSNRHGKVIKHFPGVQPREGVGEGWRESAKWKTIYILSSIYFYVRLKWAVLVFSSLCMAGERVPVGDIKTDCDFNTKTQSIDLVSILNLKSGSNEGGQSA